MTKSLFLIFNHTLTPNQEADARQSLDIDRIVEMPEYLKELWRQIPAEPADISDYIEPVRAWLKSEAKPGDAALIQGDFGATFLAVRFALESGLIPVYSTTVREAAEELGEDGSVKLVHRFRHKRFRKYGNV